MNLAMHFMIQSWVMDPQPGTWGAMSIRLQDNGGVHINSGIPNFAFYKVATKIGGKRMGTCRDVSGIKRCVTRVCVPVYDFHAFARLTLENAEKLYGRDSRESRAVQEAWDEVGVLRVAMLV